MGKSLIEFDTDHIKHYVFATNKLKEIRGASSLLDYLNRIVMGELAEKYHADKVYANGGAGLFLIDTEQVDTFGKHVQRAYRDSTGGGASVTYVSQVLPEHITDISDEDIPHELELLDWKLQDKKNNPPEVIALASHPYMRLCDACGSEYADAGEQNQNRKTIPDADEEGKLYCVGCLSKRERDSHVKNLIVCIEEGKKTPYDEYLWDKVITSLRQLEYDLPPLTERPQDFNVFSNFKGSKNYIGLIYADANNMGRKVAACCSLQKRQELANIVDNAIYKSVCTAIAQHLQIKEHIKPAEERTENLKDPPVFPFDILLLGGDDVLMLVPASVALDVALTIAEEFPKQPGNDHTLSVGVVLAPVKYPFGLLRTMADTTLKFAKKAGSDARAKSQGAPADDTRINFMIVTGSSDSDFKEMYKATYQARDREKQEFHATLRPYTPEDLGTLLEAIRGTGELHLGRTKLHQIREAVLQKNLTTSVSEGLAILTNWHDKERSYVVKHVYEFGQRYQMPRSNLNDPCSGFPHVTFPWFADGESKEGRTIYRTPLLDFVELYDFVSRKEGDSGSDAD